MRKGAVLSILLLACWSTVYAAEECWTLEFESETPRRLVIANPLGEDEVYWYVLYKVTNKTKAERFFIPDIRIETETKRVYKDSLYGGLESAVEKKEGKKFLNFAEMIGKVKPGEIKSGIALFSQIDPAADEICLVVLGITNEFKIERTEEGKKICRHRALIVTYKRPGDEHYPASKRVYFYSRTWAWR